MNKYKAIAKFDCEAEPHSWTEGLDYEVIERPSRIVISSNEGRTYIRHDQKEQWKEFFDFIDAAGIIR